MGMDENRPELRSRSPEIEHQQSLVLKWLLITVGCVWGAGAVVFIMIEIPPSIAIYFVSLFLVSIVPFVRACQHLHVWVQLDHEYRERHSIRYDNRLVQFGFERPYLGTGIVIGVVFGVVALLAILGG